MTRHALVLSWLLIGAACHRQPPRPAEPRSEPSARAPAEAESGETDPERQGAEEAGTASRPAEARADLEELRALGPTYIPYDRAPKLQWDTESEATLRKQLLPVLRERDLAARTRAIFWLLVGPDGHVAETVVQTSSGSGPFDEAAAEVARALRFSPAVRAERPVATWILQEVSLLMP